MPSHVKMVSETSSIFIIVSSGGGPSQAPVRSVAARLAVAHLAATERYGAVFRGLVFDRREPAAAMRPIAERLAGALAAGAPPVRLAGLHFHPVRAFLSDRRLCA